MSLIETLLESLEANSEIKEVLIKGYISKIKELEEQNKEMLDCLIDIIKAQYNNDGTLATLNGAIANSKHVIEKQTGKKIEEILK